ncbi:hypothetical protein B4U80_02714, partial [Leptotrombidium deliense]
MNWCAEQKEVSIISMSLGGPSDTFTNNNVKNIIEGKGILIVVAAGNNGDDARKYSPASEETAFTVAASNTSNTLASFSNYGPSVDIIAPGVNCKLAKANSKSFITLSGTSMATPLVAGWAAIIKGCKQSYKANELIDYMNQHAAKGLIQDPLRNTPNQFIRVDCVPDCENDREKPSTDGFELKC